MRTEIIKKSGIKDILSKLSPGSKIFIVSEDEDIPIRDLSIEQMYNICSEAFMRIEDKNDIIYINELSNQDNLTKISLTENDILMTDIINKLITLNRLFIFKYVDNGLDKPGFNMGHLSYQPSRNYYLSGVISRSEDY